MIVLFFIHANPSKHYLRNKCFWFSIRNYVFMNWKKRSFFIILIIVLINFLPLKLITRMITKKSWPLWMFLNSGILCMKEFHMESLCIQITQISNISWLFMFWINIKLNGHYCCFDYDLSSHYVLGSNKGNMLFRKLYFMPKEGDATYE